MAITSAWTAGTAGGCPKYKTWNTNPQFHLSPAVDGATYTLTLTQSAHPYHPIGLWVMTTADATRRKTTLAKPEMVAKTKYKAAAQVSCSVPLPIRRADMAKVASLVAPQLGSPAPSGRSAGCSVALRSQEEGPGHSERA